MAAVLVLVGACTALALLVAKASTNSTSAASKFGASRLVHEAVLERGANGADGTDGAAAEEYADRAFPASEITAAEIQGAIKADAKLKRKGPKLFSKWDSIGPDTLDVDRLGTQSFIKPTQWSGRVTALTVSPKCDADKCTLYVGAAGGGVWQTKDALAKKAHWKQISQDIPTNAIGSIAVDPNDPTGKTLYVGTGEANGSGDSEAGLGLYKSTDEGKNWSLVPGSTARCEQPLDRVGCHRAGQREPHPDRHALRHAGRGLELDEPPRPLRRSRRPSACGPRPTAARRSRTCSPAVRQRGQVRSGQLEHGLRDGRQQRHRGPTSLDFGRRRWEPGRRSSSRTARASRSLR